MARISIVTDSSARFPAQSIVHQYPVSFAPMQIHCGGKTIEDRTDVDMSNYHSVIEECQSVPKIEPFSVDQIASIYARLQSESDQILSIHTSAGLCNAVANAEAASRRFLGKTKIQVIDSQSVSYGLGLLIQAVVKAASHGADFESLIRLTRNIIPRLYMVFFMHDLLYLEENQYISRSQAILGNMLGIIPFLTLEDGKMIPMEKVRSRTRAIEKLIEFALEFSTIEHLAILQESSHTTQESLSIIERLRPVYPDVSISTTSYGACLTAYLGLDGLGIVILEAAD
jgi:DegV family protein with EDD domain